jgi:hypothetical protein
MIKHYLTVALRNLWKYRLQSVISIVGLAVGFVCFSTAALWIRYEMTYDHFHRDADRMYIIQVEQPLMDSDVSSITASPLAAHLKETFPEVEESCNTMAIQTTAHFDGKEYRVEQMDADSILMRFFNIRLVAGSLDFLLPGSRKMAVTEEQAARFFGDEEPLGQTVRLSNNEWTVCAVVGGWSKHSNFPFDILVPNRNRPDWSVWGWFTLVRLEKTADSKAFAAKLHAHRIEKDDISHPRMLLTPLTALRYHYPLKETELKYEYILLFACIGALVIICSLFNTLTLYAARFRIREKELALRTVCGASVRSLFLLLSVEFVIIQALSFACGMYFIRLFLPYFRELSGVQLPLSAIYAELSVYAAIIILLSLTVFLLLMILFRRKTLSASIRRARENVSRKISVVLQLVISISFIFCTTVMMLQLRFLHRVDLGFEYKNTASVMIYPFVDLTVQEEQLKQIPEITETLKGYAGLLPKQSRISLRIDSWDDMPQRDTAAVAKNEDPMRAELMQISKEYVEFYNLRLAEGEMRNEQHTVHDIMINEAAAKAFGWTQAVGKHIRMTDEYTVIGVMKNIHSASPVTPVKPEIYGDADNILKIVNMTLYGRSVLFKYREGQWKQCRERIEQLVKKEYPDARMTLVNAEETFDNYLKSESALMKLLGFVSFVCVIISVFGLFSLVALSCEKRRKEIAVRKIHGATMRNILGMFFREYALLLVAGAAVAFPAGYYIMKRWLEQYTKQTDISPWVYAAILSLMAAAIVLCTGWRVYRTSRENPADVLKTD